MEILLGKGANVRVQDERGDTPIHTAVRAGNEKILKVRRALKTKGQIGVSFYSTYHLSQSFHAQEPPIVARLLEHSSGFLGNYGSSSLKGTSHSRNKSV